MPIDIVVNGYFRSGTTFFWNYLKNYLKKNDYISLYEPLHPNLANLVLKQKKEDNIDKLHGLKIFDDYLKLPNELLYKILKNNPNANDFGINNDLEIENYLKIIHQIPQKVFLQPNRLHFHLDLIFKNYTNKVIHIIRHPLDVWLSIEGAYDVGNLDKPLFIRLARTILKPVRMKSQFEIEKNYNWILYKIGYPVNYVRSAKIKYLNKFNAFEKFIVVWTISNYIALQTIEKYKGLVIPYERILIEPYWFRDTVSEFLNIYLEKPPNVKKDNYYKFDSTLEKKARYVINKYEIQEEFQFCMSFLYDFQI